MLHEMRTELARNRALVGVDWLQVTVSVNITALGVPVDTSGSVVTRPHRVLAHVILHK